jgi:uncharacterized protein YcfJ
MTTMTTTTHELDVAMLVRDMPEPLRKAVRKDAVKSGLSFGYVVGKILGDEFGVEVGEQARTLAKAHIGGLSKNVTIRVPAELRTRIRVRAASLPNGTVRGVVIEAVAQHYGKKSEPPTRRKRIA